MRVLIIGGTRFSGPHVVRSLNRLGCEIALFHRGETEAELPDTVRQIHGDRRHLTDYADVLKNLAPDIVLDMIALTERDAREVMSLFRGIARRVIVLSSQDVYRAYGRLIKIESGPPEEIPLTEDSALRTKLYPYRSEADGPDSRYWDYDKILIERTCMGDGELPGTILRLPMVYGPGDAQHRLFPYLKRMDDRRPIILLGKRQAVWRWTKSYVENVAAAIVLAVTDDRAAGRIYNVGETIALSEADWVKAIGQAAGWPGRVVSAPEEKLPKHLKPDFNPDQHLVTDSTLIRKDLGYQEPIDQIEALQKTVEWERLHPPEKTDPRLFDYVAEDAALTELEGNHN